MSSILRGLLACGLLAVLVGCTYIPRTEVGLRDGFDPRPPTTDLVVFPDSTFPAEYVPFANAEIEVSVAPSVDAALEALEKDAMRYGADALALLDVVERRYSFTGSQGERMSSSGRFQRALYLFRRAPADTTSGR